MLGSILVGEHLAMRPGRKAASPRPYILSESYVVLTLNTVNHNYSLAHVCLFFSKLWWKAVPEPSRKIFSWWEAQGTLHTLKRNSCRHWGVFRVQNCWGTVEGIYRVGGVRNDAVLLIWIDWWGSTICCPYTVTVNQRQCPIPACKHTRSTALVLCLEHSGGINTTVRICLYLQTLTFFFLSVLKEETS